MPESKVFHGTCLCGDIAFEVAAAPVVMSSCHCSNCRKYTGTAFTTNVVFPAGSITVTKGDSLVSTYLDAVQDSGNALQRKFCSRCGTPLYNIGGDFGKTLAVFYSALDDYDCCADGDTIPKPKVEYYSKDRLPWVGPIDGAQQPRTKPGRDD